MLQCNYTQQITNRVQYIVVMAKKKTTLTEEMPTIVVGLDIGTTKIATIIGFESSDGKIEVIGYGKAESTGVQHGLIFNLNKTIKKISYIHYFAFKRRIQ